MTIKNYHLIATAMTNTLPVAIAPHEAATPSSDNPYLPNAYRNGKSIRDLAKHNWRNGIPVVPASSFKGVNRHTAAAAMIDGRKDVHIDEYNLLAIGGVMQRGEGRLTPNDIEAIRKANPLVALFGASAPGFVAGSIRLVSDLEPVGEFQLQEVPIVRTQSGTRMRDVSALDKASLDELNETEVVSSRIVKDAEKNEKVARDILKKAEREGTPDVDDLRAVFRAAQEEVRNAKSTSHVQTGNLQTALQMPAGLEFKQQIKLQGTEAELALIVSTLMHWGMLGGLIGSRALGAGGGFTFEYRVLEASVSFPMSGWNEVGTFAVDENDGIRESSTTGVLSDIVAAQDIDAIRKKLAKAA